MAAIKIRPSVARLAAATTAGPGQKPPMPQPRQITPHPATVFLSTWVLVGKFMGKPIRLFFRRLANKNPGNPRAIAPPITNISEGSQGTERSRKPITLAGLAMPEMIKPQPKPSPPGRLPRQNACCFSQFGFPQITCISTEATTKPVTIKTPVATSERSDRRESPHTPCPLVQPDPSRVP